jgi:hypothetical protein
MTESIFATPEAAPATTEAAPVAQPQVAPEDQLLKAIVNEQGAPKYQSVADALKALANSQEHIKRIEQENASLREKTIKAETMESILAAIKPQEVAPAPQKTEAIDINATVEQILLKREQEAKQTENLNLVIASAKKAYGEKVSEVFYSKAAELGFSLEAINSLSSTNPKAVLKLLGLDAAPSAAPTPLGIRTDGFEHAAPTQTKSAMAHGSSADLVAKWREAGEKVKKQLANT